MAITTFEDVEAEFEALEDADDRYRLIIALGEALPSLDVSFKTDANKVRGCASQVWLHPSRDGDLLRFAGDSDAAIVKGLVALVLMLADGRMAAEITGASIRAQLEALGLSRHLSSQRTQGLASMIARIDAIARDAETAAA